MHLKPCTVGAARVQAANVARNKVNQSVREAMLPHCPSARAKLVALLGSDEPPRPILERITSMLRADPNWNGGDYYSTGGVVDTLVDLRENTLRSYGIEEDLEKAFPERASRNAEIRNMARMWAEGFDANSLLALGERHDAFRPAAEAWID